MAINPIWARGIDISSANGLFNPSAAIEPIDFVFAKCSEGVARDPLFGANHDICAAANIPFAAYHYLRTTVPWKQQADNFLGAIAGRKVCMLFWDYETKWNVLTPKTAADAVMAMSYLRQMTGKPVGLYADRQRTFEIYRDAPASRDFALWFAQYPLNQTGWKNTTGSEPQYVPQFSKQVPWLLWQYASELNWLGHDTGRDYGLQSHSVDINCYRGTKEEMIAYLSMFQGNAGIFDGAPPIIVSDAVRLQRLWDAHPELH